MNDNNNKVENINTIEQLQIAKEHRDFAYTLMQYSDDRLNKLSDSLANKLLQIATIIFAFSTVFISDSFKNQTNLTIKIILIIGLCFLLVSIVFAIVHDFVRRKFWENWSSKRNSIFKAFDQARQNIIPLREAFSINNAVIKKDGLNKSNDWSFWVQFILLILGTLLILVSFSFNLLV